ncbi:NAD(P)-binding domain-containing protein [Kribbella sp. NBC_01245]|uniref:NAD(P)-dependent oxidoreductase n=1 Tax=Kribbella sp. NBC_01245 TaxID=2903578 RepID=UPI002E2B9A61|nr:NAD(P)-binding domain-containing protein [Kribbella sp. NBC_01245]
MTIQNTPVTIIGLGLMGQALAGAFLRNGYPTTVWNRTAAKGDQLVAEGARLAGSAREAVLASPLVVVCVTDYDALRGLLDPETLDGRVLINLSSGTSAQARETATWVGQHGGSYLDGGIMAVPQGVGTDEATVVYSGPREVFDQYEPVLRSLSADNRHLGEDHGLSSLYEVAVLGLMWSMLNGFLQGAALLGAAGVSASAFTPVAALGIKATTGWLAGYAEQIDDGEYPVLDATIDTHLAAMEHVIDESSALGVNAELPRSLKALADRAAAAGYGRSGYPALIELLRKPADS